MFHPTHPITMPISLFLLENMKERRQWIHSEGIFLKRGLFRMGTQKRELKPKTYLFIQFYIVSIAKFIVDEDLDTPHPVLHAWRRRSIANTATHSRELPPRRR